MSGLAGHDFKFVEHADGHYRLHCECGWESPASEYAKEVGEAWDEHRTDASTS